MTTRANRSRQRRAEIADQVIFTVRLKCSVCKWWSSHSIPRIELTAMIRVPPECITCKKPVAVWWQFGVDHA